MPDRTTLAALLADPARVAVLLVEEIPARLAELGTELTRFAAVEAALAARLCDAVRQKASEEQYLTIDQAAVKLGVTKDWLRRRPDLPFVRKLSEGVVRYSARAIDAWRPRT